MLFDAATIHGFVVIPKNLLITPVRHRYYGGTSCEGKTGSTRTGLHGPALGVASSCPLRVNHYSAASLYNFTGSNKRLASVYRAAYHGNMRHFTHNISQNGRSE